MTDLRNRTLGRFQLSVLLGEGGMGRVYRAFDTTLERNVAIKLLQPEVVHDPERLTRFVREARAASALNHPNVITVYDIGDQGLEGETASVRYIAMELVDGATLRHLIQTSHLDLRKGLKIAIQVAEGLAAAHGAGIVHRDLKPENIMVNGSGLVKVLDFGIAKLRAPESSETENQSIDRTIPKLSGAGMLMGTVGYMSPEQAQGLPVDARTDVFSLGCVIYEIASGQRAFRGNTSIDILHGIIHTEPGPLREIPPELARIVRKTLAKDPEERYQSVKDTAIDLRNLLREIDSSPGAITAAAVGSAAAPARRWWLVPAIVAVAVVAALAGGFLASRRLRTAPAGVSIPAMQIRRITSNGNVIEAALSPDAKFLAYVISNPGESALYLRDLRSSQNLALTKPMPASFWGLAFSPDGASIYYGLKEPGQRAGAIHQISTLGGQPRKIVERIDSPPAFSPDGRQMVFLRARFPSPEESAVMVSNADGTGLRVMAKTRAPDYFVPIFFAGASWSPDGQTIATAVITGDAETPATRVDAAPRGRARIVAIDASSGSMRTIADHGWVTVAQVGWLPDQHGLIAIATTAGARSSQVWHVPYPSGEPQPITRDLFDYRVVSLSADGRSLVTVAADATSDVWIVGQGKPPRRIEASKLEGNLGIATLPDGRLVMTSLESGKVDLFLMNADGTDRMQLTHDPHVNRSPAATRDGKWIVYLAITTDGPQICRIAPDGTGRTVLAHTSTTASGIAISPDDRSVIYEDLFAGRSGLQNGVDSGEFGLARVSIDGGAPERLGAHMRLPAISPDGTQLAGWLSDENGANWLATMPILGGPAKKFVQWPSSSTPMVQWAPDGKGLVFNTVEGDRSNLWLIPLDGSPMKKLTGFDDHYIFAFAPLPHEGGWAITRGELSRDAMMITNFTPPR